MARTFIGLLVWLIAASAAAGESMGGISLNSLTPAEKEAGSRLLFNGTDLDGWKGFRRRKPGRGWSVEDGTVVFSGKDGGHLTTTEEFADFELELEWRIGVHGNSGIFYHVSEREDAPEKSGPEMQLLDNAKPGASRIPLICAGACIALYPPAEDATLPAGSWNRTRLVMDRGKGEHWINGKLVVSYQIGSDDWVGKVKVSKFAEMKRFAATRTGRICLQDHGSPVGFRNIRIRVLARAAAEGVAP